MSRAESAAIIHRHQSEYSLAYDDAVAAKGADAEHRPDAVKKLAEELAAIERSDPAYYSTIISQLNNKFKAEDFGLPPGERLLGGLKHGDEFELVSKSADGMKINYYGETLSGDSKTGKIIGLVGQTDNARVGDDPRRTNSSLIKMSDGSGIYTEGKNDHNMWDVARHILGYDKLDTLAKKNEAANLIKLLEKDPENARKIREGALIHLPAMTFEVLPEAPLAVQSTERQLPSQTVDKPSATAPVMTDVQADEPVSDTTIEALIKQKNSSGAPPKQKGVEGPEDKPEAKEGNSTPAEKNASALVEKVKKENLEMSDACDSVFTKKAAAILGIGEASQIRFGGSNDVEDAIWYAKKYSKENPNDLDAQKLIKGLEYMKDHWSKFEVSGMSGSPYLDAASFKRLMEKRIHNLAELERLTT